MSKLDSKIGPKIKAFRRQLGMQADILAEEIEHESWFLELLYARPSGHMRRKYSGERPHTQKHSRALG